MFQILKTCLIGLLLATSAAAFTEDSEKTLHIVANSSVFNYKSGENLYEGDVKVDQGATHLTADRVVTKNNAKHKIEEAIAYGFNNHLAQYTTLPKDSDAIFDAKAKVIKFYPIKSIIILEGDVTIIQGENSFHGAVIIYNIKDQTVTAPSTKNSRATIVIEPNQIKS